MAESMSERRFRFGIVAGQLRDLREWTNLARRAEDLGYATFLVPDTLYTPAPLPALAAAAAGTRDIRLGSWVLCDSLRNPHTLAWEAATLDTLSGGRFELGIGVGRPRAQADADRLAVPFGTAPERVTRLAGTLAVLKETLDADGTGFPQPVQRPRPPILVAGNGPRLLGLAAREADTVTFGWPPQTDATAAADRVAVVRRAAGDRFDDLELAAGLLAVGDEPIPWMRDQLGVDVATLAEQGSVNVLTGTPRQMADTLLRRRDTLGISYITVNATCVERLAPVVAELAGR